MIRDSEIEQLRRFLIEFPDADYRRAETMYVGYVSCIKPIKTICSAEFMCHPDTYNDIIKIKEEMRNGKSPTN